MTRQRRSVSIMPTVDDRRRPDLHFIDTVSPQMTDGEIGRVVEGCMAGLRANGITPDENMLTLEVKFA